MSEGALDNGRRQVLAALPLAAVACLGCQRLAAQVLTPDGRNRFAEKTGMTTEQTYAFCYGTFIPVMQSLAKEIGRERLVAMVTKAVGENGVQAFVPTLKNLPSRDIKALATLLRTLLASPPANNAFAYEVVEQTEKVLELKFTACLPAKLLCEMKAQDIGYAIECSGFSEWVRAFNPRMTVSSPKNMMKGDAYCIERVVLEA